MIWTRLEWEVWLHHWSKGIICLPWFLQILHFHSVLNIQNDVRWCTLNVSCTQPYSCAELITACICPWAIKCKCSIMRPAPAQPRNFHSCKGPQCGLCGFHCLAQILKMCSWLYKVIFFTRMALQNYHCNHPIVIVRTVLLSIQEMCNTLILEL